MSSFSKPERKPDVYDKTFSTPSCGNVFRDLGLPDAEKRLIAATTEIVAAIQAKSTNIVTEYITEVDNMKPLDAIELAKFILKWRDKFEMFTNGERNSDSAIGGL